MASTLEEVKLSGGSEQKSGGGSGKDGSSETREEQQIEEGGSEAVPVDLKKQKEDNNEQGGGSGKDGSSKTIEEQQKEEDGGSEEVPVDLKNPKADNDEQGGSGGGSGKDDDGSSSGTDSSSKTKKPWYLVSPTDPIEDEDEVVDDEDEEERAERKEGIYCIRGGNGLSHAMETDNAVAFIYIMRYVEPCDSEDMYLVKAIRGEKYSIVKALLRHETTNLLANIGSGNALHFACEKRHEPLACLLIEHARNRGVLRRLITDTKYRNGLTPIDVAKIRGLHEVLGLLNEIARSVRNAKANLSGANLSEDKTAGSSTKLAETNPSKKQKML
ncbi:hypothetical protein OROGR_030793 [Orobanche gracilis]